MELLLIVVIFCVGIWLKIRKQNPPQPKYDPPPPRSPEEEEAARQSLERHQNEQWNELTRIINADASVLAIKRRQLVYSDSYGVEKTEAWLKEVEYYIKIRGLEKYERPYQSGRDLPAIANLIDYVAKSTQVQNVSPTSNPLEFERQCAETLQRIGWSTQLTVCTGDQGIDIIATKKKIKVVIQCKLYAKPVGNGAVQEIAAGRSFERADYAVVVTTSGFTKSARTLAKNTQVLLLDFAELAELDSRLSI
jgi:restriction system protein